MLFDVEWDKSHNGAWFSYHDKKINIGTEIDCDTFILENIMHEVFEIVSHEMRVRLRRPDCDSDYIFVFDHRQHTTIQSMMAGIISKFIM
jgi:hypothetical protein